MKLQFNFLTGDCNFLAYGRIWVSEKFNNGDFDYWLIRELQNLEGYEGHKKYQCTLAAVAPSQFADTSGAIATSGIDEDWESLTLLKKVELVYGYMGGALISTESGNNYKQLFKAAQQQAITSTFLFGIMMDRPQNQIGANGWDRLKGIVFLTHSLDPA